MTPLDVDVQHFGVRSNLSAHHVLALAARSNMRVGRNVELRNRNFQLIQAAQQAQFSGTPANAKVDLVAVQKGLEEETQRHREAEMAIVEQ